MKKVQGQGDPCDSGVNCTSQSIRIPSFNTQTFCNKNQPTTHGWSDWGRKGTSINVAVSTPAYSGGWHPEENRDEQNRPTPALRKLPIGERSAITECQARGTLVSWVTLEHFLPSQRMSILLRKKLGIRETISEMISVKAPDVRLTHGTCLAVF